MKTGNKDFAKRDPDKALTQAELVELMGEFAHTPDYKYAAKKVGCSNQIAFREIFSRVTEDRWADTFYQAKLALMGRYWAMAEASATAALKNMDKAYGKNASYTSSSAYAQFSRLEKQLKEDAEASGKARLTGDDLSALDKEEERLKAENDRLTGLLKGGATGPAAGGSPAEDSPTGATESIPDNGALGQDVGVGVGCGGGGQG